MSMAKYKVLIMLTKGGFNPYFQALDNKIPT